MRVKILSPIYVTKNKIMIMLNILDGQPNTTSIWHTEDCLIITGAEWHDFTCCIQNNITTTVCSKRKFIEQGVDSRPNERFQY